MKRNMLRAGAIVLAGGLLVTGSAFAAGTAASPGTMKMNATKINGEVYVKASSLTSTLGGTGTYDASSKTYSYTPPADVPSVVSKVSPSVVGIIGKPADGGDQRYVLAHGTGVIMKADGWILTNAHVVKDMTNITVVTADGKQYSGKRSNVDEVSDLALVKINATKLPVAKFAASPLQAKVGETVIAIGTPVSFSLRNTATTGVLSGMNRSVSSFYRLLQTDAAINPGNSGGPLVNMKGEVIGINSMKFVDEGIDNIGFSIPIDTVSYVTGHFFKYGTVKRSSLGIGLEESYAAIVGLPTDDGLTVTSVKSESAKKLGIQVGDVLYSVAGKQISSIVELNELLKSYLPGQQIEITMMIDGDLVTRKLTLTTA
ncbi:trypsin-like peptidase domain-containing protein [Paenibacillus glycanilyticus]|uniref:S1C family serine protease n=1 Tax=Paenibacillus glycanilyticus TaxID=126569 RepID=UPI00203F31F5|nr:trypsin-like peptidase domain-containing protein [Paenibacillus glycanilyticus]MCM3628140.1 trypsin-like peptidase domain-containing protein [Paenibacillus glycanilyticus]